MKLADFNKQLAEKLGVSNAKAAETFSTVMDAMFEVIEEEGSFRIPNKGTFKTSVSAAREAREGVNPRDPEGPKLQIPAIPEKKTIKFKISKSYQDTINE